MKNSDDFIRVSLRKGMQKIDDDSFTDRIVEMHLSKKGQSEFKPFLNFGSLIIGISSLIISIGLILSIRISDQLLKSINLSEQDCFILFLLSLIFLIYFH